MDCWTRVRVRHEQPCPDRPIDTPPIAAAAAMFRSGASSKITCGLLPPNSRETRLMPLPDFEDVLPDAAAAGEMDLVHPRMGNQRLADGWTGAEYKIENAP